MSTEHKVQCPQCKTLSEWRASNPHRPFCSRRCQLIDLGEWLNENRSIPGDSGYGSLTQTSDDEHQN